MAERSQPIDELILVADLAATGKGDRFLRRAMGMGSLVRLRRGVYVANERVHTASDDERYDLRIAATLATRRTPAVLSHHSAVHRWGLPIVNRWPAQVHFTVPPESGKRTANGVVIHRHEMQEGDAVLLDGMAITSLERALVDLARIAPLRDAVAALDAALASKMTTRQALLECLARASMAGSTKAAHAIDFASPLSESPGESFSRVLMHELRFPAPELQHEFSVGGRTRRSDFWWKALRLAGEFDGKAKYFDPDMTGGRTAEEVWWAEKLRENELRETDARLTRWSWTDLEQVTPFIHRLEAAGLRRTRPGIIVI